MRRRNAHRWWQGAQWYIVAVTAAASFALGTVGFFQWHTRTGMAGTTMLDDMYLSLQLFVLQSGAVAPPIPIALELARYLAPATAAYGAAAAAAAVFAQGISLLRIRRARNHAVICGLTEESLLVAEGLSSEERIRVAIVDASPEEWALARARSIGATVVTGDPTDLDSLRRAGAARAKHLVAMCSEDAKNAEIAVRAVEMVEGAGAKRIEVLIHIMDTELCALLKKHVMRSSAGAIDWDFFSIPESGARAMLDAVPVEPRRESGPPHILIVGLGKLGRSLLIQAARLWWHGNPTHTEKLRVTIVDKSAESKVESLRLSYPGLDTTCDIRSLNIAQDSPDLQRARFLYGSDESLCVDAVYVCPDDDVHSLVHALNLYEHTRHAAVPVAVRTGSGEGLARLVDLRDEAGCLRPVRVLHDACKRDMLRNGHREALARAIHDKYVETERARGRTRLENASIVAWSELPADLRESNRAQARDISQKLATLGMSLAPQADWTEAQLALTGQSIERLAILEHQRWLKERKLAGWKYAPGPKNVKKKTSPCLVEWEALPEDERDKDRAAVRAIPEILARAGLTAVPTE